MGKKTSLSSQNGQKKRAFQAKWAEKHIKHEFCLSDDQKACSKVFTEMFSRGILENLTHYWQIDLLLHFL
jgi:hypothetical protein